MPFYIGENKIVDRYIGDKLVIAAYKGESKYFDAYSEITGSFPIVFKSRATVALKNYRIYGTSAGAGVETENLAPPLSEWKDGYVSANGSIASASVTNKERYSPKIPVKPNATYQWDYETDRFPSGKNGAWSGLGWYDNNDSFISRNSGTVNTVLEVVAPANAAYAILSFRTYDEEYNTMFIKSSTAPTSYIPHGYKLPLTVESGAQSQDIPIYIGSTKLSAEEYVDYGEQKVYKRTANIYDGAKTQWINDVLDDNGQSTGGSTTSHYTDNFTKVIPEQTYYHNNLFTGTRRYYFYDQNKVWLSRSDSIGNMVKQFTTPANCAYIRVQVPMTTNATDWCITPDTPSSYIPYLDPQDPPVPLPPIPTYKGENTLSSTETLGEATIKGRINELPTQQSDN